MKALFLAVQEPSTRQWAPVARVVKDMGVYKLAYTRGALDLPEFRGFGRMHDLKREYVSEELFPLLQNRVLPKSRPEYKHYLEWLGLSLTGHEALDELARTGGLRATDSIELIPCPEPNGGNYYHAYFFARGSRYLPEETQARLNELRPGDRLFIMKDIQNTHDHNALVLRTGDPISIVGYAPRYYAEDFARLADLGDVNDVVVTVDRVNPSAPMPYRLLCKIQAPWPDFFSACASEKFQLVHAPA